jgi:WhiB family redox-sensing transcriptional regulator
MTMATRNHQLMRAFENLIKLEPDEDWQNLAVCASADPEVWFPEKGGSTQEAKKICLSCPVRRQCLQSALDRDERFGVFGGYSERERRSLKTADQQSTASDRSREARTLEAPTVGPMCGTESGAKTHSRRGERSCRACQSAATSARRQRKITA